MRGFDVPRILHYCATPTELWSDNRGDVDAAPTNYKGRLFVGTRNGEVAAYDAALGAFQWSIGYGNGPIKTPIVFAWPYDTILFTSDDELHSVQFTATGGCVVPPCTNWTVGFVSARRVHSCCPAPTSGSWVWRTARSKR
jgi:outer membrane protein assembly factor BamB